MLKLIYPILFIFLASCASHRGTPYQNNDGRYGVKVIKIGGAYSGSLFKGNSRTAHKDAYDFSMLGALDHCHKKGEVTVTIKTIDASTKASYTQVSSSNYTVPGYSKFKGKTYRNSSKDKTYTNVSSYPVTKHYPNYITLFKCVKSYSSLAGGPSVESLSKELVSPITKDFKGGLFVKKVKEDGVLQEGDVIINMGGARIDGSAAFTGYFDKLHAEKFQSENIKLKIIRKQKIKKVSVELENITRALLVENVARALVVCKAVKTAEGEENQVAACRSAYAMKKALEKK